MKGRVFRADIEGLRAIAVLGVLLFHVAPGLLRGGFVGVDVFFVISGYLIAGGILAEARDGSFSYLNFYARRLRRLAPAYLAMMAVVFIGAQFVLLPKELIFLGEAALASVLYVSNLLFMVQDGYFSDHLKGSPLLHTWSLSVEEQFYLVFPVTVVASLALPRRARVGVWIACFAASIIAAEVLLEVHEASAFFFAPARFWQFLVGAALAAAPAPRLRSAQADALALGGLTLIVLSYLYYSAETRFPGLMAAPPTIGAAAVIAAGGAGRISDRVLGNSAALFFGRISYSLYLWHWPIIVLWRTRFGPTEPVEQVALVMISILAGWASYRLVEAPTRSFPITRRATLYQRAGLGGAAVAVVAAGMIASSGFPQRFTPESRVIAGRILPKPQERRDPAYAGCFLAATRATGPDDFDASRCLAPARPGPRVALIGDSHADHYAGALRALWPGLNLTQVTASGCRPIMGAGGVSSCTALMRMAFDVYLTEERYDHVILAARWKSSDAEGLARTVSALAERAAMVTVIGPILEYHTGLPRLLAFGVLGERAALDSPWSLYADRLAVETRLRAALANGPGRYVSALDALCDAAGCRTMTPQGVPMQFDYGHLTPEGAIDVIRAMRNRQNLLDSLPSPPKLGDPTVTGATRAVRDDIGSN